MKIKTQILMEACLNVLRKFGVPFPIAEKVVQDLINNDNQGYSSHGILRIPEYVEAIKQKNLIPNNKPQSQKISDYSTAIDGKKAFGALAKEQVISVLISHLKNQGFGFVSLVNSGHLGRLKNIGTSVSKEGGIVIGFSNFSGSGQNVPPCGGAEGRLATNPILFSVPSKIPLVLDISTTAVAEGKVREASLNHEKVPEGWLIDKEWNSVTDPQKLYQKPQEVFLSPLGGQRFGHKRFGLALITEILSGILTGGGFSNPHPTFQGNSAFFIVFSRTIFGKPVAQFERDLRELISYMVSMPTCKRI